MPSQKLVPNILLVFLMALLASCTFLKPSPVRSSWSEQLAAMDQASIKKFGNNLDGFVLISVNPWLLRTDTNDQTTPTELRTICVFLSAAPVKTNPEGKPLHALRTFFYNDHSLTSSMKVDDEMLKSDSPDPLAKTQMALIKISPQDALQSILEDAQTFLGHEVTQNNFDLWLEIGGPEHRRVTSEQAEQPIWVISFAKDRQQLTFWIDAETGKILKRYTDNN